MVITSIINFAKPAYKKFAWKFNATVTIALSFILWIVASFLALWTWSNLFYDIWEIVKSAGDKIRSTIEGE